MTASVTNPAGRRDQERGSVRRRPVLPYPPDDVQKYAYLNRSLPYLSAWLIAGFLFLIASQVITEVRIGAAVILVPFTALYAIYQLISLPVNFTGRGFSLSAHRAKVVGWEPGRYPDVDIYLPICGEDPVILRNTWNAVWDLIEAYQGQAIAYVLDDGADPTARQMAAQMGFEYIVRPNRGWYRKSGNLRHAFGLTNGEYCLILDADFTPRADLFAELLPYFDDPDIAIVQSPQYFRTTPEQTWVERAGSAIQEVFYRSIQVSRDRYGAAICVGTCAIYRRAALEPHGGPHLIEYAEDVHTGLDVHKDGKRLIYVPLNLASGTSPDNIHAFVHQQVRWCTGNIFTVILGRLWTVKMSPLARLSHISGFFYYVASALAVFSVPAFPVVLLLFAPQTIRLSNLLLFGPSLWTGLVMYPNWHLSDYRLRDVLPLTIIRGWAHVLAIWDYTRGRTLKWEPSGAKVNRVRRLWWSLIIWNGSVAAVWLGMTAFRLEQTRSLQFLITAVTGLVNASVTARAIYAMSERGLLPRSASRPATYNPKSRARPRNAFALAFSVLLAGATVAAVAASGRPTSGTSQALPPVHISKLSKPAVRSVKPVIGQGHPVVGMYDSGIPQSWTTVAQWDTAVGTPASVILYYNGWGQAFQASFATTARAHGAELLVDLDPTGHQNLSQIAQGAGDAWLRSYAKQVAQYGYPVVIAFAHEMNGNWYPWGYSHQPASAYVAAWRHVVQLFRDEGASNVTWMWTVNAVNADSPSLRQWWPGSAWVNWVGIDGYYYYATDTFASVFGLAVAQIRAFTSAPIMIAETAVGTTSDREAQIENLMAGVRADHMLGFVWFDEAQNDGIYHQDWRLQDDPAALAEFKVAVRSFLAGSAG